MAQDYASSSREVNRPRPGIAEPVHAVIPGFMASSTVNAPPGSASGLASGPAPGAAQGLTAVQPEGWARPRGYANGIVAPPGSRLLVVAGQIGWGEAAQLVHPSPGEDAFVAQFS